ncbi:MAG: cysteine synthase A [Planctomycetia bacterium]|nr:cysteine synthase A [Planctomycetia bacterium]
MALNFMKNILEGIGHTPVVAIKKLNSGNAEIYAKVESFNPAGSVKDRVAVAMIEDARRRGILLPGGVIVEPTSGNTGIGLALVSAVYGYRLILTMPETMSVERRKLLAAYGTELVLTPGKEGMLGAIRKAEEIVAEIPGAFMPQQFENPVNPAIHKKTTAVEIWEAMKGEIDVFVATVGTGGTLTGVGEFLKERNPGIHIVAVEPAESAVLSGGHPAAHKIQGIGAGFIPKILNVSILDEVLPVTSEAAGYTARMAAREEGLLVGISSGAALYAALEVGKRAEFAGKKIVTLFPDSGERYLSGWLFESEEK